MVRLVRDLGGGQCKVVWSVKGFGNGQCGVVWFLGGQGLSGAESFLYLY